jgi:hypothetical protein
MDDVPGQRVRLRASNDAEITRLREEVERLRADLAQARKALRWAIDTIEWMMGWMRVKDEMQQHAVAIEATKQSGENR